MIKKAEVGGVNKLTTSIRGTNVADDQLLETVEKVVQEETDFANPLLLEPGTLSIFCEVKVCIK